MPKNFRKIPQRLLYKLKEIDGADVIVGCVRKISDADIQAGLFAHLGLPLNPADTKSIEIIPPASRGKFSERNINGEEIIRYDLPMETHYNYIEAPDWRGAGTHQVPLPYSKRPRDFIPPRNTALSVQLISSRDGLTVYKFILKETIKKADEKRLFECINLLQENVGLVDIYPADYDFSQYLGTLQIAWEVLPPGEREKIFSRLTAGRPISPEKQKLIEDRYQFLTSLKPAEMVVGTSGMHRYFGGRLRNDLVVFENIEYGNAIYIMYAGWEELSKRSRIELMSGRFGMNFDRVVHVSDWKGKVKKIVDEKLN